MLSPMPPTCIDPEVPSSWGICSRSYRRLLFWCYACPSQLLGLPWKRHLDPPARALTKNWFSLARDEFAWTYWIIGLRISQVVLRSPGVHMADPPPFLTVSGNPGTSVSICFHSISYFSNTCLILINTVWHLLNVLFTHSANSIQKLKESIDMSLNTHWISKTSIETDIGS